MVADVAWTDETLSVFHSVDAVLPPLLFLLRRSWRLPRHVRRFSYTIFAHACLHFLVVCTRHLMSSLNFSLLRWRCLWLLRVLFRTALLWWPIRHVFSGSVTATNPKLATFNLKIILGTADNWTYGSSKMMIVTSRSKNVQPILRRTRRWYRLFQFHLCVQLAITCVYRMDHSILDSYRKFHSF